MTYVLSVCHSFICVGGYWVVCVCVCIARAPCSCESRSPHMALASPSRACARRGPAWQVDNSNVIDGIGGMDVDRMTLNPRKPKQSPDIVVCIA
ncbi:unnamed protein product [Periconia digitata]|uniref:Uncharacterized protein n=1 Tax=Periconia digitata TaxID=1303443 RepID=A0A9W4XK63_9PLEO|nr:unnamed protein product [Periconia digitata]